MSDQHEDPEEVAFEDYHQKGIQQDMADQGLNHEAGYLGL
jgi:hypothetical protein